MRVYFACTPHVFVKFSSAPQPILAGLCQPLHSYVSVRVCVCVRGVSWGVGLVFHKHDARRLLRAGRFAPTFAYLMREGRFSYPHLQLTKSVNELTFMRLRKLHVAWKCIVAVAAAQHGQAVFHISAQACLSSHTWSLSFAMRLCACDYEVWHI